MWCLFRTMRNGCISEGKADLIGEARERRQNFTTWGILGLALFISVGMAEWSKRTAAGETVIDPVVMEEAVKIAAAAASNVNESLGNGSRVAGGELPNGESGKRISKIGNEAGKIETSAGELK